MPNLHQLSARRTCLGRSILAALTIASAAHAQEEIPAILKPGQQLVPAPAAPALSTSVDVLGDVGQFYAGLPQRPRKKMTLNQAIQFALQNNPDIEVEAMNPEIQKEQIREAWGAFDPEFNATATYEWIETPQDTQEFIATGGNASLAQNQNPNSAQARIFQEENYRYKVGFGGKLPLGTQYELKIEANQLDNTLNRESPFSLYSPEYTTFSGLVLTQPLLRDGGTNAGMIEIRLARKNQKIAELDLQANVLKTVASVMRTYQDLVFAVENVRVKKEAVKLSRQLLEDNRKQLERGMRQERDVLLAESAVSKGYEELLLATNFLRERSASLARLTSKTFEDGAQEIVPAEGVAPSIPKLNRTELLSQALKNRPAYLKTLEEAERENLRVQFAKNQILPKFDLKATLGYNGLSSSMGDSIGNGFEGQTPEASIGFVVSIPLGNVKARALLDAAQKKKIQAAFKIQSAEADAMLAIDKAISGVQINSERVKTAERSRTLNERSLRSEELSLERGTTTSLNLLKFQQDYTEARTREIAAEVDLSNSLVDLWEATGVLLEKKQISFGKQANLPASKSATAKARK